MPANNKVVHGARCVVLVGGQPVGVFTSVSYGVNYSHQPIYILGKASAAEIAVTGMDVVTVECHGWRVLNFGPFAGASGTGSNTTGTSGTAVAGGTTAVASGDVAATGTIGMPQLQQILSAGPVSISIIDRSAGQSGASNDGVAIMQVDQCRIVSFRSQLQAKQAMDFSVTFVGITYSDESGAQQDPSFSNVALPG